MKKFLNSVIPFSAEIGKLFGKSTVAEARAELKANNPSIEGHDLIPGAVEIPLEKMIEAGFSIKFFLKDATDAPVDTFESGIIIASIQHNDTKRATVIDGNSFNFDPKSEVEIATLGSLIVKNMVPDAFGPNYDIIKLMETSSDKIRSINEEAALNKKIRDEKVKHYEANPELAKKHTKKALENLKHKHKQLMDSKVNDTKLIEEFQLNAVRLIGEIFGINNIKTFEDLKKIPEVAAELAKGGSLKDVIENISNSIEARAKLFEEQTSKENIN